MGHLLALEPTGSWFFVRAIIHCLYPEKDGHAAEIYVSEVGRPDEVRVHLSSREDGDSGEKVKRERLVYVPHSGEWLRESITESGQIFDYVELMPKGAARWVRNAAKDGKRLHDFFEPDGVECRPVDQIIKSMHKAADELVSGPGAGQAD
jgi:hypothetical protein